jgi:hypothetical protein
MVFGWVSKEVSLFINLKSVGFSYFDYGESKYKLEAKADHSRCKYSH